MPKMQLYFLRHGEADWPDWNKPDDERPLTKFGKRELRQDEALKPGFGMSELRTVVKRHHSKILMLVGHEPDFSSVISALTGARLKLSKGGVGLVDVEAEAEEGKLLWLFPPKFA